MAKHDQRPDQADLVCINCKRNDCDLCVDCLRVAYTDDLLCECRKDYHKECVLSAKNRWTKMISKTTAKSSPGSPEKSSTTQSSENRLDDSHIEDALRSLLPDKLQTNLNLSEMADDPRLENVVRHPSLDDHDFKNDSYRYLNERLESVWVTSVPVSDEDALEYFKNVDGWGKKPKYVEVSREGMPGYNIMPYEYTDGEVKEL